MKTTEDVYAEARKAFDLYAGMPAGELPADRLSSLQVQLVRWQIRNFGAGHDLYLTAGISEEIGEALDAFLGLAVASGRLSHAVLKHEQKIRDLANRDDARKAVADGLADLCIYAMQLATSMRLDFGTVLELTAKQVMKRDFKKHQHGTKEETKEKRKNG